MTATLKNKNYKRSQKGRSMVEMLGVLAIVGVLSVGGVYGYGVAMKKHKANELLHQASMLATTISAQIQSKGQLPQNIENFGDAKYGTFNPPSEANAEQFTMKITGMDEAVCEQMEKMAGGMVRKAECSETTLTLTYNNNLSSEKVAADYNDDTTGEKCEDAGYKWCGGECKKDCCSGVTLNSCQESCDSATGEITPKEDDTDCTTVDGKEGMCSEGVCIDKNSCPSGCSETYVCDQGNCVCPEGTYESYESFCSASFAENSTDEYGCVRVYQKYENGKCVCKQEGAWWVPALYICVVNCPKDTMPIRETLNAEISNCLPMPLSRENCTSAGFYYIDGQCVSDCEDNCPITCDSPHQSPYCCEEWAGLTWNAEAGNCNIPEV
ncbi:MAG: type II secretion system protein [Alphaproteobacteria bacterium]|nr:type II secretion system protein [Alphaproteobacteria bacterium]